MRMNMVGSGSVRKLLAAIGVGACFFGGGFAAVKAAPVVTTQFQDEQLLTAAALNANFNALRDAINANTPTGMVAAFVGDTAPSGWMFCDGAAISRTTYKPLYDVIKITHGGGDGANTFNLPDYRGRFLRGVDGGAGRDPNRLTRTAPRLGDAQVIGGSGSTGDAVGSVQGGATARPVVDFVTELAGQHTHVLPRDNILAASGASLYAYPSGSAVHPHSATEPAGEHQHKVATGGDAETRPINIGVRYIIKL